MTVSPAEDTLLDSARLMVRKGLLWEPVPVLSLPAVETNHSAASPGAEAVASRKVAVARRLRFGRGPREGRGAYAPTRGSTRGPGSVEGHNRIVEAPALATAPLPDVAE